MANIVRLGGGSGGGGAKIGVTLNDDGTQNLFIVEKGQLPDFAAITADADAEAEDVLYGKTFYSMGVKKVGSLELKADLLWSNPDPTTGFPAQTLTFQGSYSSYLVELVGGSGVSNRAEKGIGYLPLADSTQFAGAAHIVSNASMARRVTSCTENSISFGEDGWRNGSGGNNTWCIPTRIWGVNFTL